MDYYIWAAIWIAYPFFISFGLPVILDKVFEVWCNFVLDERS